MRPLDAERGICDERAYLFPRHRARTRAVHFADRKFRHFSWMASGESLRIVAACAARSWCWKCRHWIRRLLRRAARPLRGSLRPFGSALGPPAADPRSVLAHRPFRRHAARLPRNPRTGKNCLREPGLAEYYDHLALITRGSLWDRRRLATIWNMNLGRYERLLEADEAGDPRDAAGFVPDAL